MPRDPIGGAVRNLFRLRQLENDVAARADELLRELFDDLASSIVRVDPLDAPNKTLRQQRLRKLLQEVQEVTGQGFAEVRELIEDEGVRIGMQQAEFAASQLRRTVGRAAGGVVGVDIGVGNVTEGQIRSILTSEPFRGAVLSDWTANQAERTAGQVARAVQLGMAQAETTGEIVRRVRGRSEGGRLVGGALNASRRETEALVRTAINHTATRAHVATFEENRDVTDRYTYTAVLDSRTSQICMGLDGQTFSYDDPDRVLPPAHFNCRSVATPEIKWEELGIEAPESGTRASEGGQVSAQTTYEDWLRDQPKETQIDILGESRANLFRANRIDLKQLVAGDNRRRTVDELKELAGMG